MSVSSVLPKMPWWLIGAACFGTFAVTASGSTRAPFLINMADDLGVHLSMIAHLFGYTSVAWGVASFAAGAGSDLFGRRPFIVGGPLILAVTLIFVAEAQSYLTLVIWIVLAGGCSGVFTGVSLAEVAARVDDRQRARAMGWVMSGQSLTLLIGIPMAAWIGADIGWRGVHLCVAGLAILAAVAMLLTTRPGATAASSRPKPGTKLSLGQAMSKPILLLLTSVVAERICFGLASIYYATFLQVSHQMSLAGVAVPLAIYATGNILGTLVGGVLGDRVRDRRHLFASAMTVSAGIAWLLFGWLPSVAITVALGFAYAFANAVARPALMALVADVPAQVRGTVMGLNSTFASLGWLLAALLGGFVMSSGDFAGFGPLVAVLAVVAALLSLYRRP